MAQQAGRRTERPAHRLPARLSPALELYAHPAANGRGRGSKLADLIWYWVSPGAHMHQEQVEPGPAHDELSRCTRDILAGGREGIEELARRCAGQVLDDMEPLAHGRPVRLRDVMMPICAGVFHEIVFGARCPPTARTVITRSTEDVLNALKCCTLRHMPRRFALTRYLLGKVRAGEMPHLLPASFTEVE
ncbi:hypothetical protein AB0I84_37210 [Streptomyces spectabilis]|uniref:hypothetical protein n=1 Tax=Streptomyces spectabilis TaxID=68270 RepID=UPI0034055894